MKCDECHKYLDYLLAQGKDPGLGIVGTCFPIRRLSGGMTTLCNLPVSEKNDFIGWCDRGSRELPEKPWTLDELHEKQAKYR